MRACRRRRPDVQYAQSSRAPPVPVRPSSGAGESVAACGPGMPATWARHCWGWGCQPVTRNRGPRHSARSCISRRWSKPSVSMTATPWRSTRRSRTPAETPFRASCSGSPAPSSSPPLALIRTEWPLCWTNAFSSRRPHAPVPAVFHPGPASAGQVRGSLKEGAARAAPPELPAPSRTDACPAASGQWRVEVGSSDPVAGRIRAVPARWRDSGSIPQALPGPGRMTPGPGT